MYSNYVYIKKLAHTVMEADKSQELQGDSAKGNTSGNPRETV